MNTSAQLDTPGPSTQSRPAQPDDTVGRSVRQRRRGVLRFAGHYLEMVVAMLVGMAALGVCSALLVDLPDRTWIELIEMAVWMTVPMTAWMRWRGHRWRICVEMAVVMNIPSAIALVAFATGVVTDDHALLMGEHIAMFPAMLVAMLLRVDEYTGHQHHV